MLTSDLDDIWRRFVEGGRTSDYFDAFYRWSAGRSPLVAFVIGLEPFPSLTELARQVQLPLRNLAGIDFVPPHLLRVVVLTIGFAEAETGPEIIGAADLARLSDGAAAVLGRAPLVSLRLGGVNSLPDRIFVEVEDGGAVVRLRQALAALLPPAVRPPAEASPSPRVEIAYYTGERRHGDVVSVLAGYRKMETEPIEVGSVELVTTPVIRARRSAPLTLLRRYNLGKEAP
jgi:hypothetical protein